MKHRLFKKLRSKSIEWKAVIILVILSLLGIAGWLLAYNVNEGNFSREIRCSMEGTIPYEAARVRGAVVKVEIEGIGSGSGVFIRPNLILTAGHVIDMASMSGYYYWLDDWDDEDDSNDTPVEFIITCDDGTELISTEYYRESNNIDVGFLIVDSNGLDIPAITFNDNVFIGERVFAIGSPLGNLFNSVTSGIISALDRKGFTLWDSPLIQTDCPINPGNSGCPLFNMKGQIVGMAVGGHLYTDGLSLCVHSKVIYWVLQKYDAIKGLERVIGE